VTPLPPVGVGDHVLGRPDAKLTLVEYGDFGCPHCFAAKLPIESLLERYDDLRFVWRHLPDSELHPGADLAAEFSELAASHGKFWQAHSLLLAGRTQFSTEDLLAAAGTLDLEEEAETALADRTFRDRVEADRSSAEAAGARGTPTFFIDGERLTGHWRQLAEIVPAALS
jgi:protein-disulfide isomerase